MNRKFLALAATLSLSSALAASPAQTLFTAVNELLQTRYGGLSTVNRAELATKFQAQLDEACAPTGEACTYETAFPIVERQIRELADGHTFFNRPEAYSDFKTRSSGGSRLQYGIKLGNLASGEQVITGVIPGSAGDQAGLKRGDRLTGIDGQKYSFELLKQTREKGQTITLEFMRGTAPMSVQITASVSTTRDLPTMQMQGDVAVLRIPTFTAGGGVGQAVHDLVREAQSKNARAMLVDLRDNPGGDLNECDMSVSAFVPTFTRVARTAQGDQPTTVSGGFYRKGNRAYLGVREPAMWNGPVAVLVNKGSASCSEFFSSEIQYAKRGTVIGEATAGVGNTATMYFPLPGEAAIQLTTVHYVKPEGNPYSARVTPDVAGTDNIELLATGVDQMLQQGLRALTSMPAAAPVNRGG